MLYVFVSPSADGRLNLLMCLFHLQSGEWGTMNFCIGGSVQNIVGWIQFCLLFVQYNPRFDWNPNQTSLFPSMWLIVQKVGKGSATFIYIFWYYKYLMKYNDGWLTVYIVNLQCN
jgi:hypothetical protein